MLCGFGECRHSIVSRVSVGFERVIEEFWLVQHSLRAWGFSFMVLGFVTSFLNRRSPPNPTPSIGGAQSPQSKESPSSKLMRGKRAPTCGFLDIMAWQGFKDRFC